MLEAVFLALALFVLLNMPWGSLDHYGEPLALWAEAVGTAVELLLWPAVAMILPMIDGRLVEKRR